MKTFTLAFILSFFMLYSYAGDEKSKILFSVSDYGAAADNPNVNTTTAVFKALSAMRNADSAVLLFPKGTYHFYVDSVNKLNIAFEIKHLKNVRIEGSGSKFIFHGPLMIGRIDSCENVVVQNFEIDWERPYITQGQITKIGKSYIDLAIDSSLYPYRISSADSTFLGVGENWQLGVVNYNLYDKEKQEIVYRTRDMALGNSMFVSKAREIKPGIIRFFGDFKGSPDVGDYVTLWHGRYMTEGFNMFGSKDVKFENINIYHCPSHGIVGVRCENITIRNVNMIANKEKGRVFSLLADALHFNACKGNIIVEGCTHTGQGDDFINVHGMYVQIAEIIGKNKLVTGSSRRQFMTIGEGEEIWYINKNTLQRNEATRIKSMKDTLWSDNTVRKIITLDSSIPSWVTTADFIENKSFVADFEIRNCNILKKHRARGILVTTPGRVVIENNYFRTAGAAILIEGDVSYWYESGACRDVKIVNNTFEDCFTSGHEWGEAVITITPSYRPDSENAANYHHNIRIENNVFKHYDYALLYARAVKGLYFNKNSISRTFTYKPFYRKAMFFLDGCKDVEIANNKIGADVLGKNVVLKHSTKKDISIVNNELTIDLSDNIK